MIIYKHIYIYIIMLPGVVSCLSTKFQRDLSGITLSDLITTLTAKYCKVKISNNLQPRVFSSL